MSRSPELHADEAWPWRPLALASAAGVAILLIYLVHPLLSGFRLPIGPDGPVYTWLGRLAEAQGFLDAPGGGPGIPALTAFIDSVFRIEALETVTLLGPVLAATTGLAAGALLEETLGRDSIRTVAAVLLTGAFSAYLAGGWLANVAMVAVFLAALAVLSLASTSARALWAGIALLAAAGLAHRIFIEIGAVILLGAAAWRLLRARGAGVETASALRLGAAALAGPGAALLAGAWLGAGPRLPGDTSQDGFFRRNGMRELLLDRYRERFLGDAGRAVTPVGTGLGLAIPWEARTNRPAHGERYLRDVMASWAVLTVGGLVLLLITAWGPPYRLIQFSFFLPIAAAAGFVSLVRHSSIRAVVAALLGVAFVVASMVGWFRQTPALSTEEITISMRGGAAVSSAPTGTPLVFLVDTKEKAAAYHVTRAANVIKTGIPAERVPDVRIVVGQPDDFLARRPTIVGDREHDRISEIYLREAMPFLDQAVVLVLEPFNRQGFESAAALASVVADGVVLLDGDLTDPVVAADERATGSAPARLLLLSIASLVLLGVAGWGWARWMLGESGDHVVVLAAPSVGVAVAILATVAADRVGLLPGGPGAMAVTAVLAVTGYALGRR